MAAVRAASGVQVRFATQTTSEDYVAEKLWRFATLRCCPWHPAGGCGFSRHGTYERVRPPGTLIPRWYCPRIRRTVSALPALLLGSITGAMTSTPALNVVTDAARSAVPALGYAGTYTFANVFLTVAGALMMTLLGCTGAAPCRTGGDFPAGS